jgi:predicted lipoprotein with Yx(FWY)xxD motif
MESSSTAAEEAGAVMTTTGPLGTYLVDANGMTLYMFTNDTDGTSACYGDCAAAWPPLLAGAAAGEGVDAALMTTVARTDGTEQVKYGEYPLYYFANDTAAGETNGQGLNGKWYVVGADGEPIRGSGRDGRLDEIFRRDRQLHGGALSQSARHRAVFLRCAMNDRQKPRPLGLRQAGEVDDKLLTQDGVLVRDEVFGTADPNRGFEVVAEPARERSIGSETGAGSEGNLEQLARTERTIAVDGGKGHLRTPAVASNVGARSSPLHP